MARRCISLALIAALALAGCGSNGDGTLDLAFISSDEDLYTSSLSLSEPAQHIRAATAIGLVARDAQGEVIPALADRWIVTEDGLSFIFRLRSGNWPDGKPITAQSARTALLQAIRGLRGTPMALDVEPIDEVRAMAGRVIELRLSGPFPSLLQLLAQPELALKPAEDTGEMSFVRQGASASLRLKSPDARGLPEDESWQDYVREVRVVPLPAKEALASFDKGKVVAVLGGQIDTLPLVDTGPLARGTIRIDPVIGLFGLRVRRETGPLASATAREAIAMAIDRQALISPFGIGGWTSTTRVVNPGLADDQGYVDERWIGRSTEDLRAEAARRIANWRAGQQGLEPGPIVLTLEIDRSPGFDLLFDNLAQQFAPIGIRLERAELGKGGDFTLIDMVARYAAPRWFLNQFNCSLRRGLCSEDVDFLVEQAVDEHDLAARSTLLAEAEADLTAANIYIPIGTPLRWSLIRGNVAGFVANQWAFHPLPPMAQITR